MKEPCVRTCMHAAHRCMQPPAWSQPGPPCAYTCPILCPQKIEGLEAPGLQISKEVIEKMKYSVFGFDTFWVTSVENYNADGVVFKGNVRGKDPQAAYLKMQGRMKVGRRTCKACSLLHSPSTLPPTHLHTLSLPSPLM